MRILLAYIHYPICSGRYVKDALMRLGHDVKSCGYSTRDQIWGMKVSGRWSHHPDAPLAEAIPSWKPDLIIILESQWSFHHPYYADSPHVIYGMDNHVRDYTQAGIEHYFLAHNEPSIMDMTQDNTTWLPCGYDPVAFTPSPIPIAERTFDVSLIGMMYEERVEIAERLIAEGFKTRFLTGLLYDEYAAVYHQTRIALNVSIKGDLNQRIFEGAALGCVVLSNPCADLKAMTANSVFQYESHDDIVTFVEHYLKEPFAADFEWVTDHTWDNRAQVIVEWYRQHYPSSKTKRKV